MKEQILEAARRLMAVGMAPSKIRIADVVSTGICTQKEFLQAFPDLLAFQLELTMMFFGDGRDAVIRATLGKQVGLQQISAAFIAYLDYNLTHPELQEIAHHIQFTPQGWDLLVRMEMGVALIVQADLEAMGANLRPARARLLTAMAVAVVRAEYQAKKAQTDLREAMLDLCRRCAG